MTYSVDEKRALAALEPLQGWALVQSWLKSEVERLIALLRHETNHETILALAMELRTLDRVAEELAAKPRIAREELKQTGDTIYG